MADYPYLAINKNLNAVFEKIRTAAKPTKFTINFMKQLGQVQMTKLTHYY